jgi:hypothetical protein
MLLAAHADLVLGQKGNKLVTVHESNRNGVGSLGLNSRSLAEVAGRNDESLVVRSKTSADLLDNWRLNIPLPSLDLHRHVRAYDITNNQRAAYVNASIATSAGYLNLNKSELAEQPPDEFLELRRIHVM